MKIKRFVTIAALALAGCGLLSPANAIPIPVGATSADDLIVNIDFSSSIPPPPYVQVDVLFSFSAWDVGETLVIDAFSGLNGTDFYSSVVFPAPVLIGWTFINLGEFLDGQFSFGLRLDQGAADFTGATGYGTNAAGAIATLNISGVPEPATLGLLGLGLAGLGFSRRKQ